MTPLGAVCSILSGGTPSKANESYWRGTIPWVSGKDLKVPRLRDAIDHVSEEAVGAGTRMVPKGSVFILVRGMGLAKGLPVAVALRPMCFNQDIKALVPKTPGMGAFIRAAIYHRREKLLARIVPSAHGTMTLNLDDIETFEIPIPNDHREAELVSTVLDLVLDNLEAAEREAVVAGQLRRAVMETLFSRGLKGEGQKITEIGLVPESWHVTSFENVRERLQYGTSTPCSYEVTKYPVLRIPNIDPGRVNAADIKYADISPDEAQRYRLEDGDLIFIRTNGVIERLGACSVYSGVPNSALFASYLIRARLKRGIIDPYFAAYFFASERGTGLIAGAALPAADGKYNLNTGAIDGLLLPLPSNLDEQREIVTILDAVNRKVNLQQHKLAVLHKLFNSLLSELMTGKIRICDLDLSAQETDSSRGAAA